MANTTEFIWYQSPEIWAAVVAGIFASISAIGTALLYKKKKSIETKFAETLEEKKAELERKNREIQLALDVKLEKSRIEYSYVYKERLGVIKEIHSKLLCLNTYLQTVKKTISNNSNTYDGHSIINEFNIYKFTDEYDSFLSKNKLYLSSKLYDTISIAPTIAMIDTFKGINHDQVLKTAKDQGVSTSNIVQSKEMLDDFNTKFPDFKIEDLLEAIEEEFRTLIGVEN